MSEINQSVGHDNIDLSITHEGNSGNIGSRIYTRIAQEARNRGLDEEEVQRFAEVGAAGALIALRETLDDTVKGRLQLLVEHNATDEQPNGDMTSSRHFYIERVDSAEIMNKLRGEENG